MADKIKDGGPAFPLRNMDPDDYIPFPGMSLRDYFAAHAPQPTDALIMMERQSDRHRNPHNDSRKPKIRTETEIIASLKYEYADAMIAERERSNA
jgi:hypothetical protein